MNVPSFELGWIITDHDGCDVEDDEGFFELVPQDESGDHIVPGSADINRGEPLVFETHPNDTSRVFISAYELEHGNTDFREPEDHGKLVRDFVKSLKDGAYLVDWGVIETER